MIPDFQTIMLPFLKLLEDDKPHKLYDVMVALTKHFNITPEELKLKVPSGTQGLFRNRVGWTRSYLKNAGLIFYPSRGVYQITTEGKAFLKTNPKELRVKQLKTFSKYQEWQGSFNTNEDKISETISEKQKSTPDEILKSSVKTIHQQLSFDLLETIKERSPQFFESFVVQLLQAMGYGAFYEEQSQVTGKTGDDGIDGIIYQDRLGLEAIYIQAKRFTKGHVGSPDIRNFIGSLALKGVNKGVFLTTSYFSESAKNTAKESQQQKIILIDGKQLANLAIEHNLGVQRQELIELKKLDLDFFEE